VTVTHNATGIMEFSFPVDPNRNAFTLNPAVGKREEWKPQMNTDEHRFFQQEPFTRQMSVVPFATRSYLYHNGERSLISDQILILEFHRRGAKDAARQSFKQGFSQGIQDGLGLGKRNSLILSRPESLGKRSSMKMIFQRDSGRTGIDQLRLSVSRAARVSKRLAGSLTVAARLKYSSQAAAKFPGRGQPCRYDSVLHDSVRV
jgi:hypothetical protein